jgi:hypothetical protein
MVAKILSLWGSTNEPEKTPTAVETFTALLGEEIAE